MVNAATKAVEKAGALGKDTAPDSVAQFAQLDARLRVVMAGATELVAHRTTSVAAALDDGAGGR